MGEWEHARPYWWQYRTSRAARPFAGAIRQRESGPDGPALWDVRSVTGVVPLVEGVMLEEAMAVVERAAERMAARTRPGRRRGRGRRPGTKAEPDSEQRAHDSRRPPPLLLKG